MRLLDRLSVRLSALLVLAGFTTLILGTGALGLFANHSGRDAFEQLRRIQVEQSRALDQAYIASLRAQVAMDRAAQLMRVPSFDRPGPVIEQAEAHLDKARDAFQTFRDIAPLPGQAESIETLASRFGSLVDTGLGLQLMLLQEDDAKGYASGLSRVTDMSEAFMESADAFAAQSAQRGEAQAAGFTRLGDGLNLALGTALLLALVAAALVFGGIQAGVLRPLRCIETHFRRIAAGDLSSPVETRRQNEVGRLFRELESMRRALVDSVSRMHHGSVRLGQGASQMSEGNQELATRTQQQAASLEQTAASLEELSATVTHNTDFVNQANALSRRAVDNAKQGDEGVLAVVDTMAEIQQRASRIDEIVGLIDAIAFQTNILALNASVEAARAGEAGRGFAVVAGEVRHLASRSVDAAREIRRLSESVQASVGRGNALSEQARTDMTAIVEAIQSASELVDQVATASAEQQHGLAQIQQAMNQMETVTQKNRAMVARAGLTAGDLEEAVGQMQAFASRFTLPREMAQQVDSNVAGPDRTQAHSVASPQSADLEALPA